MSKINFMDFLSGDAGLKKALIDHNAILTGHFLLSGGECTRHFVAKERVLSIPSFVQAFGEKLGEAICQKGIRPRTVIGPQRYGITLAYQVALSLSQHSGQKVRYVCSCKDSGTLGIALSERELLAPPFMVVDDITTTLDTLLRVRDAVDPNDDDFIYYACLVDRTIGVGGRVMSLVQAPFPRYKKPCPDCDEGIPWNEVYGHGRHFNTSQRVLTLAE